MLSHLGHTSNVWMWPVVARKTRAKLIRSILAVVLILLVGALSCSIVSARTIRRPQLSVADRIDAEQRLWNLGYWAGQADGNFDSASRHALVAFQKVEGRPRTGILTPIELTAIRAASRPAALHGRYFHVEIDLGRQVLFVINQDGTVRSILPISTGSGDLYVDHGELHRAHTPTGTFKVQRKIKGWRISSLGGLYYPSYVVNGIAIHGSLSIPVYPASHGCIRVPMYAAKELSSMLSVGTEVEIYK